MRKSNSSVRGLLLTVALLLSGAVSLAAQMGQQQQQNPPPPPVQGQQPPPAAPPVNKEEEDAYKKFFDLRGPGDAIANQQIALGEDFLKKFPESRYLESVYSRLMQDYLTVSKEKEMMAAGDKTLALNPDNVDALALMAMVLGRRVNPESLDAEQKLTKAETYAKKGIALIPTLIKPESLTDEDFTKAKNEKLSLCHSGLGFVYYFRGKWLDSAAELAEATKSSSSPDPADFLVMGIDYEQAKKYDDASAAYGKCGEITWQMQAGCKQRQANAKKLATAAPKP